MENRYPKRKPSGSGGQKVGPIRTCLGCRAHRPQHEMVRLSIPGGILVARAGGDGQREGRGAYVCPNDACIEQVLTKGRVARTLRWTGQPIDPDDIRQALLGVMQEVTKIGNKN